jgi:adenine deaminase
LKIRNIIPVALGDQPARAIVRNAKIVNVFTGEIESGDIAIYRKRVAGIGSYQEAEEVIDAKGLYALPGFIDAHLHIESSMLVPRQFAKAVLQRGTTTVVVDPHEIANVLGTEGLDYIVRSTDGIPLNVYIGVPSAVPATQLETSGATLGTDDIIEFVDHNLKRVIALGEVMNYPAVLACDRELITKIEILRYRYRKIDGHAPGLSGKRLNAYLCAFIRSDHESTNAEEALEKVRRGMHVFIREGSAARDLNNIIGAVNALNQHRFSFCTDDRDPLSILTEGHIDHLVRMAIARGIDPLTAIRMATINTADYFNLRSMGAVAPGYKADMVFVSDLNKLDIRMVMKDGRVVVSDGKMVGETSGTYNDMPESLGQFCLPELSFAKLAVPVQGHALRVIGLTEGSLLTQEMVVEPKVEGSYVVADSQRDIAKVLVADRHRGQSFSVGFVHGLGIRRGAIATSVGHDSHNLCAAGMNDDDMLVAARQVAAYNGGMVVAHQGRVLASLPLPLAGLMSNRDLLEVTESLRSINVALKELGTDRDVFMPLSFVQLAVIPTIRITDLGMVDVERQRFTSLWADEPAKQ